MEHRRDTPGRLLRLLALLQSRREWSGAELAQRLGVTDRTVRRDVDRLRALDYPVRGTTGSAGGYRLVAGRALPPLVLDDEEALAVAVGLATATGDTVPGGGEAAVRALAKLHQVLPPRLRPRLAAVGDAAEAVPHRDSRPVDADVLAGLAVACRDHEVVSFGYATRRGAAARRRAEPYALVTVQARWYLLAYDTDRDDWRTFRVDRITAPASAHRPFTPRELPAADAATAVTRSFAAATYRHSARMTVAASAADVRAGVFATIPGEVEPAGAGSCSVRLSAETPELVVQFVLAVAALGAEFTLDADDAVRTLLDAVTERLTAPPPHPPPHPPQR